MDHRSLRFQQEIEQLKKQLEDTGVASAHSHDGSYYGRESPRVMALEAEIKDLRIKLEEAVTSKERETLDSTTPQQRSWQAAEKLQQQLRMRVSELEGELEGALGELRVLRGGPGVREGAAGDVGVSVLLKEIEAMRDANETLRRQLAAAEVDGRQLQVRLCDGDALGGAV